MIFDHFPRTGFCGEDALQEVWASDKVGRSSGSSSAVERQLPKLDVTGSIPVSRSIQRDVAGEDCNQPVVIAQVLWTLRLD